MRCNVNQYVGMESPCCEEKEVGGWMGVGSSSSSSVCVVYGKQPQRADISTVAAGRSTAIINRLSIIS